MTLFPSRSGAFAFRINAAATGFAMGGHIGIACAIIRAIDGVGQTIDDVGDGVARLFSIRIADRNLCAGGVVYCVVADGDREGIVVLGRAADP